jgi:cell division protein FtsB
MNASSGNSKKRFGSIPGLGGSSGSGGDVSPLRLSPTWVYGLLLLILAAGLLYLSLQSYQGLQQIQSLAQKREGLIRDNQDLNRKNQSMYREINRLKQDPLYLEEVARKEFGLVRPDEIIFFLEEENKKEAPLHGKNTPAPHRR